MRSGFVKRHLPQLILYVLLAAGLGILPVVTVKLTQVIVDKAAAAHGTAAGLGGYVLCIFLVKLIQNVLIYLKKMDSLSVSHSTEAEEGEEFLKLCRGLDLTSFETPEVYDRIARLRENIKYLYQWGIGGIAILCTSIISVAGIFCILASAGWNVVLVSLAVLLPVWAVNIRLTFLENKGWNDNFDRVRRQQYFSNVIHTREYLKETRTFQSFGFFEDKWEKAFDVYNRNLIRLTVTTRAASAVFTFLTAAGIGVIVWLLIPSVGQGAVTLGFVVSVVEGLQHLSKDFNWTINNAGRSLLWARTLLRDIKVLGQTGEQAETARAEAAAGQTEKAQAAAGQAETGRQAETAGPEEVRQALHTRTTGNPRAQRMEVDNVWFRYPGSERYILRGISFVIEPGEQVALVGENGSGKSTLAKLVLGLYRPQKGSIRYGGVDVNAYTPAQRKEIFGVVFQDYARYEISLRENLAFQDLEDQTHDEAYLAALEKVGGSKILEDCGSLDAVVGRRIDGGVDLSNGQWQKLAIARALFGQAGFTVLDEPSSAADPLAEAEIYRQYAQLASHAGGLLITHRLSCIQFCSRILVLGGGTVVEQGTHEKLMESGGIYAQMYQMQKGWYM